MKVSICAIIKNEQLYLDEWIKYHLDLGFSDIFLFEDYDSRPHDSIVEKYDNVTLTKLENIGMCYYEDGKRIPSQSRQYDTYKYALDAYKDKCDWLALIDIDEFITFDEGYDLESFFNEFSDKNAVYLYWKIIGADGKISYEDLPVTERFHNEVGICKMDIGWCMKTIYNMKGDLLMKDIHRAINGTNTFGMNTYRVKCFKKAYIRHYFTKSWEEWAKRFTDRGDVLLGHRDITQFFECNTDMLPLKDELMLPFNK